MIDQYLPYIALGVAVAEATLHFIENVAPGKMANPWIHRVITVVRFLKRYATPGGVGRTVAAKINPRSRTAEADDYSLPF